MQAYVHAPALCHRFWEVTSRCVVTCEKLHRHNLIVPHQAWRKYCSGFRPSLSFHLDGNSFGGHFVRTKLFFFLTENCQFKKKKKAAALHVAKAYVPVFVFWRESSTEQSEAWVRKHRAFLFWADLNSASTSSMSSTQKR